MKKIYLYTLNVIFSLVYLTSCVDLNITPTSILTNESIYNENGIKAYMAGMYNHLPMEDFHYDTDNNGLQAGYFVNLNIYSFWNSTGEMVNRNNPGFKRHRTGYWSEGFKIIRQANTLIQNLPNYPELASQSQAWIAEAKFIRAYVYFHLAKRYGGMPKVLEPEVLDGNDATSLYVARESHADTYNFILKDLDDAIADMPATSEAGRANKYVAAALKSRVALYAATIARYGSNKFSDWEVDGVLLQGIPANRANDYFKQAWDAAKMLEGVYQLHRANADKTANYAEIWEKADGNKESIWLRKYDYSKWAHSYDAVMSPPRMCVTYGDRFNPTLDWVELFDGLPLNNSGHFSAFDENGNYIVYNNCQQLWNNVEPRLMANLLIPGSVIKGGMKVDLRGGVFDKKYDPAVNKFKKFSIDDGADGGNYRSQWNKVDYSTNPFADNIIINSTSDARSQTDLYDADGVKLYKNGLDGPKMSNAGGNNSATGFYGRKHLNIAMAVGATNLYESTQPWIEIRYAEILLNRAEAAVELAQNGETAYGGTDMLQDAFNCINDLRDRAGAKLLTSTAELSTDAAYTNWTNPGPKGQGGFVEAPNRALQIVRVERYKELAFESKIYWDLLRWFTFDTQIRNYRKRGLYSFMFSKSATVDANGIPDGKYIYDAKNCEQASDRITFDQKNYYETIPDGELKNNPLLQKNRFQ
jgi:hypothetical protein